MQLRQFSHKLWILERSLEKESDHSILKKYRLIRTAQKFELVFGDIFMKSYSKTTICCILKKSYAFLL